MADSPRVNGRPTTLLVIDDSPSVRRLVVDTLLREGYRVLEAENGEAGYAAAVAEQPDLAICDIEMPVLDGWGFVAKARSTEALDTMPVLMLTTLAAREHVRRAMATGADDFLTKPWQGSELADAVKGLLAKSSRHRADAERSLTELRRAVLATVPHELRTPLTSILALSELLVHRRGRYDESQLYNAIGRIHRSAGELARTIGRMMDWADLSTGTSPSAGDERPRLALAEAVAELLAAADFRAELGANLPGVHGAGRDDEIDGHRLQLQLPAATVQCDPADLRRALAEVLGNALRYSHPGLPVRVSGNLSEPGWYHLDIANMGEPIPPAFVRRLGALAQADRHRQEQQGLGLGLAIASLALQRQGGGLSFQRHDGRPTVVRLSLPLATPARAAGGKAGASAAQPPGATAAPPTGTNRSTTRAAGNAAKAAAADASRGSKSGGNGPA